MVALFDLRNCYHSTLNDNIFDYFNSERVTILPVIQIDHLDPDLKTGNFYIDGSEMRTNVERFPRQLQTKKLKTLNEESKSTKCDSQLFVDGHSEVDKVFFCKCGSIYLDPISLPCGHTFCKVCVNESSTCAQCGFVSESLHNVNVFFADLLIKLYPDLYNGAKCRVAAKSLLISKQYDKALNIVNEALGLNPDDMACYILRSEIHEKLGKNIEALKDATTACEHNPSSGHAFFRLGAVYILLGDFDQAIDAYQLCLELNSDDVAMSNAVVASLDKLLLQARAPASIMQDKQEPNVSGHQSLFDFGCSNEDDALAALNRDLLELEREMHNPAENLCYVPDFSSTDFSSDHAIVANSEQGFVAPIPSGVLTGIAPENSTGSSGRSLAYPTSALGLSNTPLIASLTESLVNSANFALRESVFRQPPYEISLEVRVEDDLAQLASACNVCEADNVPISAPKESNAGMVLFDKQVSDDIPGTSALSRAKLKRKHEDSITLDDFECKLCFELLLYPVTTPCGHVFCEDCLMRAMDHSPACPVCRLSLLSYITCLKLNVTIVVEKLLVRFFSRQYDARKEIYKKKMDKLSRVGVQDDVEVPIFVCMVAFPTLHYPLIVFEPRYKLMIRQCMQSGSRRFGMCEHSSSDDYADIGTIMEIESLEKIVEGRYFVQTTAWRRFHVRQRMENEGSHWAFVTYFSDEPERLGPSALSQLMVKYRQTYDQLAAYIEDLSPVERDCVVRGLGHLPPFEADPVRFDHGVAWIWYGLAALPLNKPAKLVVLRSKCLSERLVSLERFLRFMARHRNHGPTSAPTAVVPTCR